MSTVKQEQRKLRRIQEKENKKKIQEEKLRNALLASKSTKITLISSLQNGEQKMQLLKREVENTTSQLPYNQEEYPSLSETKKLTKVPKKESISHNSDENNLISNKSSVSVKVKRKNPILVNLFEALQISKVNQGSVPSRILPTSRTRVPNPLDSTAPLKRRGKESEIRKPKKKTTLKKIILADREKKEIDKREQREKKEKETNEKEMNQKGMDEKEMNEKDTNEIVTNEKRMNEKEMNEKEMNEIVTNEKEMNEKDTNENEMDEKDTNEKGINEILMNKKILDDKKEKDTITSSIHSDHFRNYCEHDLSSVLNEFVEKMIRDLVFFQDRIHAADPIKAKMRRRYVIGLREVKKFLGVQKISMIIIATDIQKCLIKDGLDDHIENLKKMAKKDNVPIVYALSRKRLGYVSLRKINLSCIGIMNYQGSEINYNGILELLPSLRESYLNRINSFNI